MGADVDVVHLVAKTHLDLGFTALASEVEARYLDDLFPRALAVGAELRAGDGPERLVWTTGSWILDRALADPRPGRAEAIAAGIEAGDLAWHALPVTTHTELMDGPLVRSGLAISGRLDQRFGRRTTAAKMTDVPGHTRGLVPLLAEAGVTFLHLGVNPAWPVPDVPAVFRWRSPDGAEVTVAYQAGGYGGEVQVPGCREVLAFLHAGDNLGPPSADEVRAAHRELAARHPGAEVRGSTLDAFARALVASGAEADLPVVTAEIGDPWIFGVGSDPAKVAAYRSLLRHHARRDGHGVLPPDQLAAVGAELLLVAEHTWGLDQKEALPDSEHWRPEELAELRSTPAGRRFESSWDEQWGYVERAAAASGHPLGSRAEHVGEIAAALVDELAALAPDGGAVVLAPGQVVGGGSFRLAVDPTTGAVAHLELVGGRIVADVDHPLALLSHQTFDEADYERFFAGLTPTPEDRWWARWDNTKPGIDAAGATSGRRPTRLVRSWYQRAGDGGTHRVFVQQAFDAPDGESSGAPPEAWTCWSWPDDPADHPDPPAIEATIWWPGKPAERRPEATWASFVPIVAEPERWTMDKLGQAVSPLDVVRRGGRSLHAVGDGLAYEGPDGAVRIQTFDAPLVAPGRPDLLDADPPLPDLAGGWHVLLHDNCWGTNFPMWTEGPARFRFRLAF